MAIISRGRSIMGEGEAVLGAPDLVASTGSWYVNCTLTSCVYVDTSVQIRFVIGIDLLLSCDPNVLYMWHLQKW